MAYLFCYSEAYIYSQKQEIESELYVLEIRNKIIEYHPLERDVMFELPIMDVVRNLGVLVSVKIFPSCYFRRKSFIKQYLLHEDNAHASRRILDFREMWKCIYCQTHTVQLKD